MDLNKDGYCQLGSEPVSYTKTDGSHELTITYEQQRHENFNMAPFNSDDTQSNITPLTTMIEALIDTKVKDDNGETKSANGSMEDLYTKIAQKIKLDTKLKLDDALDTLCYTK